VPSPETLAEKAYRFRLRLEYPNGRSNDPLPEDNEARLMLPIAAQARVVLVSPETTGLAAKAMVGALRSDNPDGPDAAPPSLELSVSPRSALSRPGTLDNVDTIVLGSDAGQRLTETETAAVVDAVRDGTSLLWFVGAWENQGPPPPPALALGLGEPRTVEGLFTLRPSQAMHPLVRTLDGFPERAWQAVRLARVVRFPTVTNTLYEAVSPTEERYPAVSERLYGNGRVLLVHTGLDRGASSLAIAPQFVALMQEALIYLSTDVDTLRDARFVERGAVPAESRVAPLDREGRQALGSAMGANVRLDAQWRVVTEGGGSLALWPEQLLLALAIVCGIAEALLANRL
jgi:hypothetical protein